MLKQICNCDKSRFPTDRQKCKAVSIKWEVPYKVTPGTHWENITTLTVCNAVGRAMDPLLSLRERITKVVGLAIKAFQIYFSHSLKVVG